uniref:twin-arginine translocation signal domain-containing protein n=1 Tax=Prevotella sp. TaxID=59823 RepID=UPI003FEFADA5
MTTRRDFIKKATLTTVGSALALSNIDALNVIGSKTKTVHLNRKGASHKQESKVFPDE